MKRIILWLAFFAIIGLFIYALVYSAKQTKSTVGTLKVEVNSKDWARGTTTPKVTLVEYSDFQCPACGAYHDVVKKTVDKYSNDVKFVYRNFPLIQIHKNADYAAASAVAAGRQGKFWEMHDKLFKTQSEWENDPNVLEKFNSFAKELGLDMEKFKADVISREVRQDINSDYKGGVASGVIGTPSFFVNGKLISNPRSEEEFDNIIKNAIASSTTI